MIRVARRALVLAALIVIAAFPVAGAAQGGGGILLAIGPQRPISFTNVTVTIKGSLAVNFHGDVGTGCASKGLCDYSGVAVWRPAGSGATIALAKFEHHGKIRYLTSLFIFGGADGGPAQSVASVVKRVLGGQTAGTCADASSPFSGTSLEANGNDIRIRALDGRGSVLSTRCAGPLDSDVAPSLPTVSLPVRLLLGGHRRIDMSGNRSFAAGGFAGTVQSTLVLVLGAATTTKVASGQPNGPGRRMRELTEPLRLVRLGGQLSADVRGTSSSSGCTLLDSCGLAGAITVTPRTTIAQAQGTLTALGPAGRPYKDFLAALGLSHSGNPAGISVAGSIDWNGGGVLTESLTRPAACRDSRGLGSGDISLQRTRGRLVASYFPALPLRVRCPGPELVGAISALASATTSASSLARREFSVSLRPRSGRSDDGYTESVAGALSITIKRGQPKQSFFVVPAPPSPPGSIASAPRPGTKVP